jgi:glycosyltransferase involved in cell wall biosynthesis
MTDDKRYGPDIMRIGYFASTLYKHNSPSGGLAHIRQFLNQSTAMGHEILLYHGGNHPSPAVIPAPKGRLARFPALRSVDFLYYRVEFRAPRDVKWIMPSRRWLLGSPPVVFEFNSVPEFARVVGEETYGQVEKHIADLQRCAPYCDLAVCVSQSISDYVRDKLGFRNVMTVPNGSDPDLFTPDAPPLPRVERHPGRLNVVWIGSAEIKWHNFELLRDAARLLWEDDEPVADFHILGNGMQGLRDLPPNVHYHGSEQYDKLPNWLTAMDIGLNVYKAGAADFSSPLKVFDYMACGLTLVSTDQPQVREIFQKLGQLDLVVPTDDPRALADTLRQLAAEPIRLRRQGAASRQLAVSFYNWKRAVKDTLDAMEGILAQKSAGASAMPKPGTGGAMPAQGNRI